MYNRFNKGERETPLEIVETEHQVAEFLKKGVNMITREGGLINIKDDCDGDPWPAFVVGLFVISASGDQLKLEEAGGEAMHFQVVETFKS